MTRFTRAKGSKASNERLPNEATPWSVMKQQLQENQSKRQKHSEKTKSAKELLEDKDLFYSNNHGNVNNDWAEFEETGVTNKKGKAKTSVPSSEAQKNPDTPLDKPEHSKQSEKHMDDSKSKKKKSLKRSIDESNNSTTETTFNKKKKIKIQTDSANDSQKEEGSTSINEENVKSNDLKMKKKKLKKKQDSGESDIKKDEGVDDTTKEKEGALSKRQKRNMRQKKKKNSEENVINASENGEYIEKDKMFQRKNTADFKKNTETQTNENGGENKSIQDNHFVKQQNNHFEKQYNKKFPNNSNNFRNGPNKFGTKRFENDQNNKRKLPKVRDNQEHKRRKPDSGPIKITINGVEIEIVKYDGFPIKKEDADRLRELKQKMVIKGIPKKEINAALKLERRKAEKVLARIRRCVCFHCRKAGHNLSDCPELGSEQAGTGICFKCGSTEHTHFECKVAKPTEFRYATCFICREQGHIAKQCPDNPRGVYPQGGSCKICGDVTHLKKDCPDLIKEKEETAITLDTIANGNLESLEENVKPTLTNENDVKRSKKVVTF